MDSFWNSLSIVNLIKTLAQWIVAIGAVIALVFSMRASALKEKFDAKKDKKDFNEKTQLKTSIDSARNEAESLKVQLVDANKRIEKTENVVKPKPLKQRIVNYLNKLDSKIIPAARNGQREFFGNFTFSQIAELQSLCKEDKNGSFIKYIETTNIIMNKPGTQGGIGFAITDKLLK